MPIFFHPRQKAMLVTVQSVLCCIYITIYICSAFLLVFLSAASMTQGIYYETNTRINQYCMYIYGACKGRPDAATPCTASLVIPESGICAWLSGFPYSTLLSVCIVLRVRVCVHVFARTSIICSASQVLYLVASTELQYTPLFCTQGVHITVGRWVS